MSVTDVALRGERASESIVELVATLAVVVLTILGLAEVSPTFLVAIATIVFAVSLLLYGTAALSQLNVALARFSASETGLGGISGAWSTVFLAGATGIVLVILAPLGVSSTKLVAIAVIAFDASLLISSNASMRMRVLAATPQTPIQRLPASWETWRPTPRPSDDGWIGGHSSRHFGVSGFAPTRQVSIALLELGCSSSLASAVVARSFPRAFQVPPRA